MYSTCVWMCKCHGTRVKDRRQCRIVYSTLLKFWGWSWDSACAVIWWATSQSLQNPFFSEVELDLVALLRKCNGRGPVTSVPEQRRAHWVLAMQYRADSRISCSEATASRRSVASKLGVRKKKRERQERLENNLGYCISEGDIHLCF